MIKDTYEQDVEIIQKQNELILSEFLEWLTLKGLSVKVINKHEYNVRFYINEYLLYYDALTPEKGIDRIDEFMDDWFPRKALWASKTAIKEYGASLKKFYTFMYEKGSVGKSALDAMKCLVKDKMDDWVYGVEKRENDFYHESVNDYLSAMEYSLEEYLDDIDMDTLMEFVKRHKELQSFDDLHGVTCGFAALPLFPDSDSNRYLFAERIMHDVLCSIEEKNRFEEALLTFYDCTEDFMFTEDFVPYCGSWEFKDIETNNPKSWCSWFVSAFVIIRKILGITGEEFLRDFQLELSPLLLLGFDEDHPQVIKIKKGLAENGESWEAFRIKMFKSIPDVPLYLVEKGEECMEKYEEKYEEKMGSSQQSPVKSEKVGRNDPCLCGSGKKYKKCCGLK